MMEHFSLIAARAEDRKGGAKNLQSLMPAEIDKSQLALISDRDYLAAMSKKIFQAGFVWRVVENKWPGFEAVLWDFQPEKLMLASDEQIEKMASDKRLIRNLTKVKAVRENAYFVQRESKKHQGFGHFIANWRTDQIIDLWLYLKKNGARLGGNTGPYFLRAVGKDTFILSKDVTAYLIGQGIVDRQPNSLRDLKAVQSAFNTWQQQSGLTMANISRTIAFSIGENLAN